MKARPVIPGTSLAILPDAFPAPARDVPPAGEVQTAVLAGGCFWCVEAVFAGVDGVLEVTSGYAGGAAETANYRAVCSGTTGHAEAVRLTFDPERITFGELLRLFFSVAHDPTHLNRQGNDYGPQYRSAIFFADEQQRAVAEAYMAQLKEEGAFTKPLATVLEPLEAFYEAEPYHQGYAARNPAQPYIAAVSMPKVEKLRRYHGDRLKRGASGER
jgi:peptide-methionine (S)-S-oxide reductase